MRILKFGGSSLANPERISLVRKIIIEYAKAYPDLTVVVSAQSGVTDQLVKLCELIPDFLSDSEAVIREIEIRHLATIKELLHVTEQPSATAEIMAMCNELSDIFKGASLVGEVTPRTSDMI